jgi:hypothetical protein
MPATATAEIIPLPTANQPAPLAELAREINDILGRAAEAEQQLISEANAENAAFKIVVKAHQDKLGDIVQRVGTVINDLRLDAGRMLITAKEQVAPGGWKAWVRENVKRSRADCYQCMKMAGAADPGKERAQEKADTRERVQKHRDAKRAKAAAVAASVTPPVTDTSPAAPVTMPEKIVSAAPLASAPDPRIEEAEMPAQDELAGDREISEPASPGPEDDDAHQTAANKILQILKEAAGADPDPEGMMASILSRVYEQLPAVEQKDFQRYAGVVEDAAPPECAEILDPFRAARGSASRYWWAQAGIQEAIPTTPAEVLIKYHALSWQIDFAERQVTWPLNELAGQVLLDAAALFPSKRAWQKWLNENVKTCPETTKFASYYLRLAERGRRDDQPATHLLTETRIAELVQQALAEQQPQPQAVSAE